MSDAGVPNFQKNGTKQSLFTGDVEAKKTDNQTIVKSGLEYNPTFHTKENKLKQHIYIAECSVRTINIHTKAPAP